jgi:hypothetical protein
MRFQPAEMVDHPQISARQNACLITMKDDQGNILELAMSVEFGAQLVAKTRSAFMALESRAQIEEGTTPEQRRSFAAKSATVAMPITAAANPHGTPLSPVLVTVGPASAYEQSFGLTVEWAERLAAELRTAASQARRDQS